MKYVYIKLLVNYTFVITYVNIDKFNPLMDKIIYRFYRHILFLWTPQVMITHAKIIKIRN